MKPNIPLAIAFFLSTAFAPNSNFENENNADDLRFATKVVQALRGQTVETYLSLFPTVDDFKKIMIANEKEYGPYLKDALDDFEIVYKQSLLPDFRKSFSELLDEGKKKGIEWSIVQCAGVVSNKPGSFLILITAGERKFQIEFKRVLKVNDQLSVRQFVKLS